jgi:hypothetical protein
LREQCIHINYQAYYAVIALPKALLPFAIARRQLVIELFSLLVKIFLRSASWRIGGKKKPLRGQTKRQVQ